MMDTGPVEIAAVGVSIAIFNQVSKVAIYPLVSVTTSFVAEEDAICNQIIVKEENKDLEKAAAPNSETKVLPVPNGMPIDRFYSASSCLNDVLCFSGFYSFTCLNDSCL